MEEEGGIGGGQERGRRGRGKGPGENLEKKK